MIFYDQQCNFHDYLMQDLQPPPLSSIFTTLSLNAECSNNSMLAVTVLWSLRKTRDPSLVLVQPRKTHPCLTERLLMGRKESKSNKQNSMLVDHACILKKLELKTTSSQKTSCRTQASFLATGGLVKLFHKIP